MDVGADEASTPWMVRDLSTRRRRLLASCTAIAWFGFSLVVGAGLVTDDVGHDPFPDRYPDHSLDWLTELGFAVVVGATLIGLVAFLLAPRRWPTVPPGRGRWVVVLFVAMAILFDVAMLVAVFVGPDGPLQLQAVVAAAVVSCGLGVTAWKLSREGGHPPRSPDASEP